MSAASVSSRGERVDRVGALASTVCALHCAVCALLPVAFGALGLGFLLGHEAEWVFTLIAIVFATAALTAGWRRHRSRGVALLLLVGIAGLLVSRGVEEAGESHADGGHGHANALDHDHDHDQADGGAGHLVGTVVGVVAGLSLLAGHLLSLRAIRRCTEGCCPSTSTLASSA